MTVPDGIRFKAGNDYYAYYLELSVYRNDKDDVADYRLDHDRTDEQLYAFTILRVRDLSGTYYIKPNS